MYSAILCMACLIPPFPVSRHRVTSAPIMTRYFVFTDGAKICEFVR